MDYLVEDIYNICQHFSIEKFHIIAHSFGGILALEFAKHYPQLIAKLILIDITGDLQSAFKNQIESAILVAPDKFPHKLDELNKIYTGQAPWFEKLSHVYDLIGRVPLQKEILFYSMQSQLEFDRIHDLYYPKNKTPEKLIANLINEGWLDSRPLQLMEKLLVPTTLVTGKFSQCIGHAQIERAASAWHVPIHIFDKSGHFPYFEEPEAFAHFASSFLSQ